MSGKLLLIYICNFHVLSHLLLIYICKLHWIKVAPLKRGKNSHKDFDYPIHMFLAYGWKPLPQDEHRCITIPSLLAEQYIFQLTLWGSRFQQNQGDVENVSTTCLSLLDAMFSIDASYGCLLLQYVLAPPPPTLEDVHSRSETIETMKVHFLLIYI